MDEFIQSVSNVWDDEYGGSLENRVRFPLEVIEHVTREVGADRVGFRLSPWNRGQGVLVFFITETSGADESSRRNAYGGSHTNLFAFGFVGKGVVS